MSRAMRVLMKIFHFFTGFFVDDRAHLGGLTEDEYEEWDFLECLNDVGRLSNRDKVQLQYLRVKRGIDDYTEDTGPAPVHKRGDSEV